MKFVQLLLSLAPRNQEGWRVALMRQGSWNWGADSRNPKQGWWTLGPSLRIEEDEEPRKALIRIRYSAGLGGQSSGLFPRMVDSAEQIATYQGEEGEVLVFLLRVDEEFMNAMAIKHAMHPWTSGTIATLTQPGFIQEPGVQYMEAAEKTILLKVFSHFMAP